MKNNLALAEKKQSNVTKQYLSFVVGDEKYGMEISHIMEVRSWEPLEPLVEPIEGFEGQLTLRGKKIPVVDLRRCLNREIIDYDQHSVIIIFTLSADQNKTVAGLMANAVLEVNGISRTTVELAKELGQNEQEWLTSLNKSGDNALHLLHVNRLLCAATLKQWDYSNS